MPSEIEIGSQSSGAFPKVVDPGSAYWEQRETLAQMRPRNEALWNAIGHKGDLTIYQWAQISAFLLSFRPDCILELGRGAGNSTAAFVEVAHRLNSEGGSCKVVSLCLSEHWEQITVPRIKPLCADSWFDVLNAIRGDILTQDYGSLIGNAQRVALFWDAHGYEVAGCVLGGILPLLAKRSSIVVMHDMSDQRYLGPTFNSYSNEPIWSNGNQGNRRVVLGNLNSGVEQAVAITDFASRNNVPFDSADHCIHTFMKSDAVRIEEMRQSLGNEMFNLMAYWFWFTLNDHRCDIHFPTFTRSQ
jgi:hypothetical protein